MINLISAANGKLDDPVMRQWAVQFYSDLPIYAHDERNQIETEWFHEFFIAQLIDRGEISLLTRLFRALPAKHLANLQTLIAKKYPAWPRSILESAAEVLAVIAPEELLRLFENDLKKLKNGGVDPLRFLAIDQLQTNGNDAACAVVVNQFSKMLIGSPDDFRKSMLIFSLLKVSQYLAEGVLESLFDTALRIESSEERRRNIFEPLFTGLFGHIEFLTMIFDREKFKSSLQLTTLQPFFVDSAPLEKLDSWLRSTPQLEETLDVLENLSQKSSGCKVLLKLLSDSDDIAARLSDKVKVQLSIAACLHGFATSSLDPSKFDLPITINLLAANLANPRWSASLIDHLRSFEQSYVISALTSRLLDDADGYGTLQIAQAMGELGYTDFIEPLIMSIGREQGDMLCEVASTSLAEMGSSAQAALIAQWDHLDSTQKIYCLSVISNIHGNPAADFAVARFSELLANDVEFACELILAAPDARLLELLRPELQRKQPMIDRAFYVCARILDDDGVDIQGAKERSLAEFERCEKSFESMETGSLPIQNQLFLDLECPLCEAVNRYEAQGVVISDDPGVAFLLNDEFPCASCGQDVEFKFTPMASMVLSAKLIGSRLNAQQGHPQDDQLKVINCTVGNHEVPLATGLALIRKFLADNPDDALEWCRLGNFLSHIYRPKETIAAYRKALAIEPNAVDVALALAITLEDYHQETEAWAIMQKALAQMSNWKFLLPDPDFRREFSNFYNHLRRELEKHNVPIILPSALTLSKKIGRNDSCPCGSGKKFKKCCG